MVKKQHKQETQKIDSNNKEDEISLDFGPLKKMFSKKQKKTEEQKTKKDDETVEVDFSSLKTFASKFSIVILLLIPIIIALTFRSYPANLPIAEDWAKSSIQANIRNSIAANVNQQYPNLPEANKNAIIDKQLKDYVTANQAQIDEAAKNSASYLREQFQDENGYTYLADIDSYYFMRQAQNVLETNSVCDKIEDGKCIDDHMLAPIGSEVSASLHPYAIAYTYKIMHAFNSKITLMRATFYLPFILSVLTIIVAFFAAREVAGNIGGFFAAMTVAVHPFFLTRTYGADTDVWNVFFPLLITLFVLKAMDAKNITKRIIYSVLGGISASLFAFAWMGWWYIFDFLIGALVIFVIIDTIMNYKYLKNKEAFFERTLVKETLTVIGIFALTTAIGIAIVNHNILSIWYTAILSPISFMFIKQAVHADFFPNVYTTVAELNAGSITSAIQQIGGTWLFVISIIGIFLTLLKKDIKGRMNINYFLLLLIWYGGTIYATLKGVRFTLLLVSAYALAFGIAFGIIYQWVSNWLTKELEVKAVISKTLVIIILAGLFWGLGQIQTAEAASKNEIPIINDGWYNTLTKIKDESAQDAIITSWWDFGHHFKYLADRRVSFDGASQTGYNAHWVGKMLLTDDEDLSIGFLRMIDCSGGEKAYNTINEKVQDTHLSVELINQIAVLNRQEAYKLLENRLGTEYANKVIDLTHCTPPEAYFITSEDMIGKAGVWAHFGSWDFRKAEIWISYRNMPKSEFEKTLMKDLGYTQEEATRLYYEVQSITDENVANTWVSPWPSFVSGEGGCKNDSENALCENAIQGQYVLINLSLKSEGIATSNIGQSPASIAYMQNGTFVERKFENSTFPFSIAFIPRGESYTNVWVSPELAGSMFTRLFFYEGKGLNHFEKFSDITDVTGQRIIVWKINWEGK